MLDNREGGSGQQWPTAGGPSLRTGVENERNIAEAQCCHAEISISISFSHFFGIVSLLFHDDGSKLKTMQ